MMICSSHGDHTACVLQSDDRQETMPLSSFYTRKRPARQILFSPPHYLSKTASPGLVCSL